MPRSLLPTIALLISLVPPANAEQITLCGWDTVFVVDTTAGKEKIEKANVKSVTVHPATGQTAFIQASEKAWWSDSVGLLSPAGTIQLPEERLYKARWLETAGSR